MEKELELVRRLTHAVNKSDGAYYLWARRRGAKENALAVLYALDDGAPHSQKQICREWCMPKTTVNTIVGEFLRQGYVTLQREEHTREKIICLTEEGRAYATGLMKDLYAAERKAIEATLAQYPPEFVDAMECFAQALCEGLKAQAPG